MRFAVLIAVCVAVLALVLMPTLQLTLTSQAQAHHAGFKGRGASPVGGRNLATATAATPTLPDPLRAGRAPMFDGVGPTPVCSPELFVPPRA